MPGMLRALHVYSPKPYTSTQNAVKWNWTQLQVHFKTKHNAMQCWTHRHKTAPAKYDGGGGGGPLECLPGQGKGEAGGWGRVRDGGMGREGGMVSRLRRGGGGVPNESDSKSEKCYGAERNSSSVLLILICQSATWSTWWGEAWEKHEQFKLRNYDSHIHMFLPMVFQMVKCETLNKS